MLRLSPTERHETRIALKHLRYAAELFASLFDGSKTIDLFRACLEHLQDSLGAYNDSIRAQELTSVLQPKSAAARAHTKRIIMELSGREKENSDHGLEKSWKAYRKAPRFWKEEI